MDGYDKYSKYIVKSVNHIFKRFLDDSSVEEVYEMQARENDPQVAIEIDGTISGEIVINLPQDTLDLITRKFIGSKNKKSVKNSNGDVAIISIKDTGIGIPEKDLARVFERFYRCDPSRSRSGMGLGLSLAQAIAKAHGGNISVISEEGKGSTFTVKLPRQSHVV